MALWREITRRVAYLARRSRFDRELDDELQFHTLRVTCPPAARLHWTPPRRCGMSEL
jgi:hypothetical protein